MSVATFRIGKKEFVVIPRKRYDELSRAEEDRRDAEIARRGRKSFLAGEMKTLTHDEMKRKLGL